MSNNETGFSEMTATGAALAPMLPEGTRLAGRYQIKGVLGVGGMGIVYHAHDEQLDMPVALKMLHAERRFDEEAVERFRQEIRLARKVTHPSVVRIHDFGRDGDLVFLTMDFVDGMTLRERLSEGPLSPAQMIAIARRLAEGLAAAHECGVIHRDLKPANVLVSDDGRAWLTDFGIARALGADTMTREGRVAGTPDYLSPEQIRGDAVDGHTDIYALGLLMHEMLTGEVPMRGDSIDETAARRASGRTVKLDKLADAPPGLRRIIARCLEPRVEDRYATARELAEDLSRGQAKIAVRRNLRLAGALLAAAAIIAGGAVWFVNQLPPIADGAAATAEEAAAQRIAVFPFENATGDESLNWARRGLPETIAGALAENPELQVIDSFRVFQTIEALRLPEDALDAGALRQLSALLEVGELVTGRIIGEPGARRLELSIRKPPDGGDKKIRIDIDEGGLLAAADDGVRQLREAMRVAETEDVHAAMMSRDPAAMAAYDGGMRLLARGESVLALEPLKNAVDIDPKFGPGWSALAYAYHEAGQRENALTASDKAIALLGDDDNRAALLARAQHSVFSADPQKGFELFKQVVARFPNDLAARAQLAEQLGAFGEFKEAIAQLKIVVESDPNHPRAWYLLGRFAVLSGDSRTAAEDYLVRALVIQNRVGDAQGRGEVFNAMGLAHERLGELDIARQHYRNAAELREAAGDRRGFAGSIANIARLDMIQGDIVTARKQLTRALDEMTAVGDAASIAELRNEYGVLEEEAGDYAAALEHYREALRIRKELGGEGGLAESYINLAFTYLVLGEFDNAAAFARDARADFAASGDQHGEMMVLEINGELALARGDWEGAARDYLRELELSRLLDAPFSEAVAEGGLGLVAFYQGRTGAALDAYQRAIEIITPMDDQRGLTEFGLRRAAVFLAIYLPQAAADELANIAIVEEIGNVGQRAEYYRLRGATNAAQGRMEAAKEDLAKARALAEESGSRAISLRIDLTRLRCLDRENAPNPAELAELAARIGHGPMRLEALELLASKSLGRGDNESALAAVRAALRPPVRIDPWIGNWRLNLLYSRAAAAAGAENEAAVARARAAAELSALLGATPDTLRQGLLTQAEAEAIDVAIP